MKTKLLIAMLFIANMINAQTTIDFESLTVPDTGFFNGATEYSGDGDAQIISYEEGLANFYVNYTDAGAYDYWNGFAYSNQTDLDTADYTNYSAYSPDGGGVNGSSNYGFVYTYSSDTMTFDQVVSVQYVMVANSVWAYKFMDGSDGSGHTFETGDFLKLTITAVLDDNGTLGDSSDDTLGNSLDFYLADFTNGNSYIINDWADINLAPLGNVKGLKFSMTSSDDYTPTYFAMDNLTYDSVASVNDNSFANTIKMYPNPSFGNVSLTNVNNATITIADINGRQLFSKENCLATETIQLQHINSGIYFVKIENNNQIAVKKLVIK